MIPSIAVDDIKIRSVLKLEDPAAAPSCAIVASSSTKLLKLATTKSEPGPGPCKPCKKSYMKIPSLFQSMRATLIIPHRSQGWDNWEILYQTRRVHVSTHVQLLLLMQEHVHLSHTRMSCHPSCLDAWACSHTPRNPGREPYPECPTIPIATPPGHFVVTFEPLPAAHPLPYLLTFSCARNTPSQVNKSF